MLVRVRVLVVVRERVLVPMRVRVLVLVRVLVRVKFHLDLQIPVQMSGLVASKCVKMTPLVSLQDNTQTVVGKY